MPWPQEALLYLEHLLLNNGRNRRVIPSRIIVLSERIQVSLKQDVKVSQSTNNNRRSRVNGCVGMEMGVTEGHEAAFE